MPHDPKSENLKLNINSFWFDDCNNHSFLEEVLSFNVFMIRCFILGMQIVHELLWYENDIWGDAEKKHTIVQQVVFFKLISKIFPSFKMINAVSRFPLDQNE